MPSRDTVADAAAAAGVRALLLAQQQQQQQQRPPGAAAPHFVAVAAAARAVVNAIVGSPTAKRAYAAAGVAPALAAALRAALDCRRPDDRAAAAAAAALGALAYASETGASAVAASAAPDLLVRALFATDKPVVQAAARALKVLLEATPPDVAEVARIAVMNPSRHLGEGQGTGNDRGRDDEEALDDDKNNIANKEDRGRDGTAKAHVEVSGYAAPAPARIVALLGDFRNDLPLAKFAAGILAGLSSNARDAERLDAEGATRGLVALLRSSNHQDCLAAALAALVALTREHGALAERLLADGTLTTVLPLLRSRWPQLRLLACTLIANVHCIPRRTCEQFTSENGDDSDELSAASDSQILRQRSFVTATVAELVNLFHSSWPLPVRIEAAKVLTRLISDSERLQQMACETGAVELLMHYLAGTKSTSTLGASAVSAARSFTVTANRGWATPPRRSVPYLADRWIGDNAFRPRQRPRLPSQSRREAVSDLLALTTDDCGSQLFESGLHCLGALCSHSETGREVCVAAGVLRIAVLALDHLANINIVRAALKCIRALSRSVKILRRDFVAANVATSLRGLLNVESLDVRRQACACICNVILEFSPMKKDLLADGGAGALVALLNSEDDELRRSALWALENATFKSETVVKRNVMDQLGYERLASLCTHENEQVRRHALNLLRNLAYPSRHDSEGGDLDILLERMGDNVVRVLTQALTSGSPVGVMENALYAVCNIASGTEAHKNFLMRSDFPRIILACSWHENEKVRAAAVWCMVNLGWKESGDDEKMSSENTSYPTGEHDSPHTHNPSARLVPQVTPSTQNHEVLDMRRFAWSREDVPRNAEQNVAAAGDGNGSQMDTTGPADRVAKGDNEVDVTMSSAQFQPGDESSTIATVHDLRIARLRELGFERRLMTLLEDPAIEVSEPARTAIRCIRSEAMPRDSLSAIAPFVQSPGTSPGPEASSSELMDD